LHDRPGFRAGPRNRVAYQPEELGPVAGLELLHLQGHVGLDTLSWSRLRAQVTGYDFSLPALEVARGLASDLGRAAPFVQGVLDRAPEVRGRQFDVV
jgi:hypothetical protein